MESKNEFKKINIKSRTCYYFDDIMMVEAINVDNILLDEYNLVYNILYKEFINAKPFRIWFDKVGGIIKIYSGIRYLELSNSYDINYRIYNKIFDKINCLITEKSDYKYSINHNFARIRIDSYNSLPIETNLTFHNVGILFKSVVNKNKNNYYYNIFN